MCHGFGDFITAWEDACELVHRMLFHWEMMERLQGFGTGVLENESLCLGEYKETDTKVR